MERCHEARADRYLKEVPNGVAPNQFEAGKPSRGQTSNGRKMRRNNFRVRMVLGNASLHDPTLKVRSCGRYSRLHQVESPIRTRCGKYTCGL